MNRKYLKIGPKFVITDRVIEHWELPFDWIRKRFLDEPVKFESLIVIDFFQYGCNVNLNIIQSQCNKLKPLKHDATQTSNKMEHLTGFIMERKIPVTLWYNLTSTLSPLKTSGIVQTSKKVSKGDRRQPFQRTYSYSLFILQIQSIQFYHEIALQQPAEFQPADFPQKGIS
ncbi:hypothetical protein KUTeg_003192 [Tegillarca granosa]|uniref:Uncharacterized protein n=1 Tax=Tegillarca granosa TaxID=220873 RepID=A0ABQ9FPL8_TEGGR|nr:hypothetical protein KUTeg_003192 [Tegillarca granosa]